MVKCKFLWDFQNFFGFSSIKRHEEKIPGEHRVGVDMCGVIRVASVAPAAFFNQWTMEQRRAVMFG